MDDEIDQMVVRVRADTQGFARDVAEMRAALDGPLQAGADRAGRGIENALLRAVRTGKLGFEDLSRVASQILAEIAAEAVRAGLSSLFGGGGGDSMDVTGALTGAAISEVDLLAGRWDGARITLFAVDWTAPDAPIALGSGTIGAVETRDGVLTAELRGAAAALDAPVVEMTSPECRAELGDKRCRVAMAGRRRFARVIAMEGAVLTLDLVEPAGGWAGGRLRWFGGANSGLSDVIAASAGDVVTLRRAPRFDAVGALVEVSEGCDKSIATCAGRFGNAANFRGEPYLPGIDLLTRYPGG